MSLFPVRAVALSVFVLFATALRGAELPIIAKARAYLGTEAVLNNIRTIHQYGTLVTSDPADPSKQTRATIELVLQRPDKQRVTVTSDTAIETTALDGYDAWTRVAALADKSKWQQTLLGADGIKRLRANTWENVAYFRGIEKLGGYVEDRGTTTIDGVTCQKVAFIHGPNIVFTRCFDVATGRVVLTETESGTIREQGEMVVDGLRMPKTVVTVHKSATGPARTVTITFDKVLINESFPPDYFAVPALGSR